MRKVKLPNKLFLRWVCIYFSMCVLIFSCYYVINSTSFLNGKKEKNELSWDASSNCHGVIDMNKCTKGYIGVSPKILVIGDSHAGQYNQFFNYLGIKEKWAADIISEDSCNFILYSSREVPFRAKKCLAAIQYAENNIEQYDTVIFISYWHSRFKEAGYFEELERNFQKLLSMGKKIYVFRDNVYAKYPVLRQFHLNNLGISLAGDIKQDKVDYQFKRDNDLSNEKLRELLNKYPEIRWVDVNKYIPNNFIIDGLPIYKDKDHINPYGARKLAERFSQHEILIKD